jgi:hypothetical protein
MWVFLAQLDPAGSSRPKSKQIMLEGIHKIWKNNVTEIFHGRKYSQTKVMILYEIMSSN